MKLAILATFAFLPAWMPLHAAVWGETAAYPHLNPKHAALECGACHALKQNEVEIHDVPGHATCTGCHNFAAEAVKRTESFCGECHTSTEASKERPALFDFPKKHTAEDFGDQFSHVSHKEAGTATRCENPGTVRQSVCTDCHAPVLAAGQAPATQQMELQASHAFCFQCHCDRPANYNAAARATNPSRNDCAVCHVGNTGKMTALPVVSDFRHGDHLFDTRPRKKSAGQVARAADTLCVECHSSAAGAAQLAVIRRPDAAECTSCHTGKPGLPDPLPPAALRQLEAQQ